MKKEIDAIISSLEREPKFTPIIPDENVIMLMALKRIPLLSHFLGDIVESGYEMSHVLSLQNHTIGDGFAFAGLALTAFDFIRIPIIYLSALLLGQKIPFSFSRGAKWLLSGVLTGLGLAALFVPAALPIIVFVSALLTTAASVITLVKLFYDRYDALDEQSRLIKETEKQKSELAHLYDRALQLAEEVSLAVEKKLLTKAKRLEEELNQVKVVYDQKKQSLQDLCNKQLDNQKRLEMMQANSEVKNRSVGVVFGMFGILGAALIFIVPPVGFGILASVAMLSVAHILAHVGYPLIKKLAAWVKNKLGSQATLSQEVEVTQEDKINDNNQEKEISLDPSHSPDILLMQKAKRSPSMHLVSQDVKEEAVSTADVMSQEENIDQLQIAVTDSFAQKGAKNNKQTDSESDGEGEREGEGESEDEGEGEGEGPKIS